MRLGPLGWTEPPPKRWRMVWSSPQAIRNVTMHMQCKAQHEEAVGKGQLGAAKQGGWLGRWLPLA